MIVFELACGSGHRFEGWFGSSEDYAQQQQRGLVSCPQCGSGEIAKAPMAPRLARKGNQLGDNQAAVPVPAPPASTVSAPEQAVAPPAPASHQMTPVSPEARAMMTALMQMQAEALKTSRWVGKSFAEDARAMHYGEKDAEAIHGQASPDEARALLEEGIELAPVLFPFAPPEELN